MFEKFTKHNMNINYARKHFQYLIQIGIIKKKTKEKTKPKKKKRFKTKQIEII